MASAIELLVLGYLEEHSVLNLCTAGPEGPWASPVFFASSGFELYFVSDPATRHGRNIGRGAWVAGSVTEDYQEWQQVQGIQLEGYCTRLDAGPARDRALAIYLQKHPVAGIFLHPGSPFYDRAGQKAAFYRLQAGRVWFTDNTEEFGRRHFLTVAQDEA